MNVGTENIAQDILKILSDFHTGQMVTCASYISGEEREETCLIVQGLFFLVSFISLTYIFP